MSARKPRARTESPSSNVVWAGDIDGKFLEMLITKHPTRILLFSGGGCMYSMTAALDYLQACPTEMVATGCCMSAAVPILAAGSARLATANTRFMVHPGSAALEADRTLVQIRNESEELERLENLYLDLLAARTKKDRRWWERRCDESFYFGAPEALSIGLIDAIA